MPKNEQSSSPSQGNLAVAKGEDRPHEHAPPQKPAPDPHPDDRTDYQALLDWQRRGMPENEIAYSPAAPKTSKKEWKDAETVDVRFSKRRR